jgi:hypothetical protein
VVVELRGHFRPDEAGIFVTERIEINAFGNAFVVSGEQAHGAPPRPM